MPSKIRVLSDHTINKIAAGEVIENPASVVKELVENSLDAGSTDIVIEIQGGGRQMIRISDNGCGMGPDDALLCLERHATSKLREVEDIHTLSTMGFRGEAIPSIASISKFNLLTCPEKASTGTMVIVDGGKMISSHPAARSQGTTIEVKSLFFNVPVRKKFLKSPAIDSNEILKTVSLIALGYPAIKFQLISDGKPLLNAPASKDPSFAKQLAARIEDVLGRDFGQNTTFIEEQSEGVTIRGVMGRPGYTRHNRSAQYLFINKRAIVSSFIAYAVKEGFGTSIPTGRFPVYILHLDMAGELVDVNVHPQKREVRLRQEQLIKELVIKAVRSGISFNHAPEVHQSPVFSRALQDDFKDIPETWVFQAKPSPIPSKPVISHFEQKLPSLAPLPQPVPLPLSQPKEQPLKVLATIPGYIILDGSASHPFINNGCKQKGGFVLIDQKNAHARILFERLSQAQSGVSIAQQTLLVPYTLELPSHESETLRKMIPSLNSMGFHIREFGGNTYLIDSIPQMFGESDIELFINDLVQAGQSDLCNQAKSIAQAATRAAVSLQKHLASFEAQSLLDRLLSCSQPYVCPSGKPTLVQISSDELTKLFQR
jgi:DNA mismatch repair protein MutL